MEEVIRRSYPVKRTARMGLYALQIIVAAIFLMAGVSKLAGVAAMVQLFDKVGLGQWFRYLTGALEVVGAVSLFTWRWAGFGSTLLAAVMVGAIITHLTVAGGSPVLPALLLLASAFIAWRHREDILEVLR